MQRVPSIWRFGVLTLAAISFTGFLASGCSSSEGGAQNDELYDETGSVPQGLRSCLGGTVGDADYCGDPCAPCSAGQGDCDGNAQCQPGLVCRAGAGPKYGLGATVDVCVAAQCANNVWDANECGVDCGGSSPCGICSIVRKTKGCSGTNGTTDYCRNPTRKCGVGEGDCHNNSALCAPGLVCKVAAGPRFGLPAGTDVCDVSSCANGIWDANECGVDCGGTSSCGNCASPKLSKGCGGINGDTNFCINPNQKCGIGQGDCHNNSALCAAGLVCKVGAGPQFGLPVGTDACVAASCNNRTWDTNECGTDCGGTSTCGPCATPKLSKGCGGANGGTNYCINPNRKCGIGEGDCHNNSALCAPGLVCKVAAGSRYGLPAGTDACVPPTCSNGVWDANECGVDCGGTSACGNCPIPKLTKGCGGTNGDGDYCKNPNNKCTVDEGDCDSDAECASGLSCVSGGPSGVEVCR